MKLLRSSDFTALCILLFRRQRCVSTLFVLVCLFSSALHAGEGKSEIELPEIIVTADFRPHDLQTIPASMMVITERGIKARGGQHLESILSLVPNVNLASAASRNRYIQIRGIGEVEQFVDTISNPSVGLVIDGVDLSGIANAATLFDIQQVEVLRGPQGTRFGTSAMGGMINIRSLEPTEHTAGYFEIGAANYDSYHLGGAISGSLSQSHRARLAISQNRSDGFFNNEFLDRDNVSNIDESVVRAALHTQLSDSAQLKVTAFYLDSDNGYDVWGFGRKRTTLSDSPGHDRQETAALAINYVYQFAGAYTLDSTVTIDISDMEYGFDEDWTHPGICTGLPCQGFEYSNTDNYIRDRDSASVDIRLLSDSTADLQWVAGFYSRQRGESLKREYNGDFLSDYDTKNVAVYGQVDLPLSERLRFRVGLRLEHFSDDYKDNSLQYSGLVTDTTAYSSDDLWGFDISLDYAFNDQTMVYSLLSRGYKAGGINNNATSSLGLIENQLGQFLSDNRLRFNDESILNIELGLKGSYWEDNIVVRAALFRAKRQDPQLEAWIWDPVNFVFVGYLDNADRGINQGVELEFTAAIADQLTVFTSVGYLDTEIDSLVVQHPDAGFVDIDGREQANAPHYQLSLGVDVELTQYLSFRLEAEARDDYYFATSHSERSQRYELLHANLVYKREQWELSFWGRNLTDRDYATRGFYFGNNPSTFYVNELYQQLGEPRVYGMKLRKSF
jgi:iron complex outermembrane recepter protein